jgi:hypothetical protein
MPNADTMGAKVKLDEVERRHASSKTDNTTRPAEADNPIPNRLRWPDRGRSRHVPR